MTELLVAMLWSVVEVLIVCTGAQVVRVVSLGRWRSERWGRNEARTWNAAGAFSFRHEGQRVVTTNGLIFVGLLFYGVLAVLAVALAGLVSARLRLAQCLKTHRSSLWAPIPQKPPARSSANPSPTAVRWTTAMTPPS